MDDLFPARPGGDGPPAQAPAGEVADRTGDDPAGPSRRTVVVTGLLAVLAGAGGGVAAAFARPRRAARRRPAVPAALTGALAAERRLLDLAGRMEPDAAALAAQLRSDHAAHAGALEAVIGRITGTVPQRPTASASASAATAPISRARQRAEEASAASRAAAAAASLSGPAAALLASIAACEAGHAELLT